MGDPTRDKAVVRDDDVPVPARPGEICLPDLPGRVALNPHKDGGEGQADVNGDDDEPDDPLDLRAGEAEEGDGEGGLAPGGSPNRPEARHVHDKEGRGPAGVLHVDVPAVPAEAHRGGDAAEDARGDDRKLGPGVSSLPDLARDGRR